VTEVTHNPIVHTHAAVAIQTAAVRATRWLRTSHIWLTRVSLFFNSTLGQTGESIVGGSNSDNRNSAVKRGSWSGVQLRDWGYFRPEGGNSTSQFNTG